jgi:peptide/nickel transport system substrate-binding protein
MKKVLALVLVVMAVFGMVSVASAAKDSIIISTSNEPTAMFTQDAAYGSSMAKDSPVLYNIHAYLAWMNEKGEIVPWVAKDWSKSDDGLTWTFHIRDDVYFHNGDKLTAEDVAFSYNLALEKNAALSANLLINLTNAEVIDEYTVAFHLKAPFDGFPAETTSRSGCLISKKYYEQVGSEGYQNAPIGCGAYKFVSRVSGQEIVMEAFDKYFLGAPAIKNVTVRVIGNMSTSFISLRSGDVDVVNLADVASSKQLTESDIATYITNPSTARVYLTLNSRINGDSILKNDLNLRRAIQYGINKEECILGTVSGAGTVIDCSAPYFFNGAPDKGTFLTITSDAAKAKEFLAASNYKGEPLKLFVVSGSVEEKCAQIIQGQLMDIGLNVEINGVDSGTYQAVTTTNSGFDMALASTTGSLCDVSTLNSFYMLKESYGPISDKWEELQSLCEQANVATGQARKDIVGKMVNIANEEALDVYIMCKDSCIAFNKNLQGMLLNTNGTWRVSDWSWKE